MTFRHAVNAAALVLLACGARAVDSVPIIEVSEPVLEMKSNGGDGGMQDVVGLGLLEDSSVVVGDAAGAQIVRIDATGTSVTRAGRRGSLVGEYQRLQWVGVCEDSVLLVHDIALSRVSALGDKLQTLSTRTVPKAFDSRDISGCLSGSRLLILNDSTASKAYGVYRRPMTLVGFNWRTGRADTIRKFLGNQINYVRHLGTSIAVPMGARTHVSTSAHQILVAESNLDSLWRFDGSRWTVVKLQDVPEARSPLPIDDQRARLALGWAPRTVQDRAFAPELLAETPTAKIAPRIDGLVASDDGTAWIALKPNADGQRDWIAYNTSGKRTGRTQFRWTFEPRMVHGATWWGVERDSIGVESVVRYHVGTKD